MENERELLGLAAKAAGLDLEWCEPWQCMAKKLGVLEGYDRLTCWHPIKDDGDALRLGSALRLHILHNDPDDSVLWVSAVLNKRGLHGVVEFQDEMQRADATCRAIVRAAAEIGRAMQSDKR